MTKFVIIHGTKGSPESNWFPWLAAELEKHGAEVVVPRLPTPEGQSLDNWLNTFQEQVEEVNSATTIIGHSIGAVFLLRLLERLQASIQCSVFVAGLTGSIGIPVYDKLNSSFVEEEFDWSTIRKNAGTALCFSGDDDPYVPAKQGLELAENLQTKSIIVADGGHLNSESGYTTFPLLAQELIKMVGLGKITRQSN